MSCKSVLKRTYGVDDILLKSFFTTILGIRDWNLDDMFLELDKRREGPKDVMRPETMQQIYDELSKGTWVDDEWARIRYVTAHHSPFCGKSTFLGMCQY